MKKKFTVALLGGLLTLLAFTSCGQTGVTSNSSVNQGSDVPIICVVTFKTEKADIKKEVNKGNPLTDIPQLPTQEGYTYAWSVDDFSCITQNLTVTLVKSANVYTITYDLEGLNNITIGATTQSVAYDSRFTLEMPVRDCYEFNGWIDENGNPFTDGVYQTAKDVTLKAVWVEDNNWSGRA